MGLVTTVLVNVASCLAYDSLLGKFIDKDVESEIKRAFNESMGIMFPNQWLREKHENMLRSKFKKVIEGDKFDYKNDSDLIKFMDEFNKVVAKYPIAFNFLHDKKNEDFQNRIENYLKGNELGDLISICEDLISEFKPKLSLKILKRLVERSKTNNNLLARVLFAIGKCHEMLGNTEELKTAFMEAHQYAPDNIVYRVNTLPILLKDGSLDTLYKESNEIIELDATNPIAYACIYLCEMSKSGEAKTEIPNDVKIKIDFRRFVYFNIYRVNKDISMSDVLDLSPNMDNFESLTYKNFKNRLFEFEYMMCEMVNSLILLTHHKSMRSVTHVYED